MLEQSPEAQMGSRQEEAIASAWLLPVNQSRSAESSSSGTQPFLGVKKGFFST